MKRSSKTLLLIYGLSLVAFICCKKEVTSRYNQLPVVWIGRDTIVDATTIMLTLDGSTSYAIGGSIVSYSWTQFSGPSRLSFSNAAAAKTIITGLAPGIYLVGLTVTNDRGASVSAQKRLMVGRQFFFDDLMWKLEYVDEFDVFAEVLVTPAMPDMFGSSEQYPAVLTLSPSNVYVKFDTTSNWLNVPSFKPGIPNSNLFYSIGNSRLYIRLSTNPQVLAGRKALIKVEY